MPPATGRSWWRVCRAGLPLILVLCWSTASAGQGFLQQLRDNVRAPGSDSSSSSAPSSDDDDRDHRRSHHGHDDDDHWDSSETEDEFYGGLFLIGGYLAAAAVTSPIWGPHQALGDDLAVEGYFQRFPYQCTPGYMMTDPCLLESPALVDPAAGGDSAWDPDAMPLTAWPTSPRTWGARLRFEYADEFDDMTRVGGHLLLSTTSRFGLDTETSCLEEVLPFGRQDRLWIGDCNVIYRFAQSEHAQFRAGIGFNWLDDPIDTNFGFNFTYGADFFPRKPWILSTTLDWGTIGRAELFRFRATAGVIVHGVEVYTGWEHLDVDNDQINSLMGGVRIWF